MQVTIGMLAPPINDSEIGGTGTGSTSDGAPDSLTQADLLNRLAPALTVRGDTFKIRAYGGSSRHFWECVFCHM